MMDMFKGKYFKHKSDSNSVFVLLRYSKEVNLPNSDKFMFTSLDGNYYFGGTINSNLSEKQKYSLMTYELTETGHGFQSPLWKVLNGEDA